MIDNYQPYRKRIWIMFLLLFLLNGYAISTGLHAKDPAYPTIATSQGPTGKTGQQGPSGLQGEAGLTVQGPKGDMGLQGPMGLQGAQGAQGDVGSQGPVGTQGDTGPQGPAGAQGNPGADGRQVEFRCDPNNNNYEYRYVGDFNWQTIEPNSNACKSSPV